MTDIDFENLSMDDWLRLPASVQQQVVASYIGAGRKPAAGREKQRIMNVKRQTRPTRRELDEAHDSEHAYPAGDPSDRWSDADLRAFSEHHDRLVEQDAAGAVVPLNLNRLNDEQLKAIAHCSTAEQVALVEQAIRDGSTMPTFATQADDGRQPIVELRWSKT